jgi:hypothetical protein
VDDDELTNRRLTDILVHLAREYANAASTVCADIRVPKDLRDQLAAHTADVLNELPTKIHRAVDPTYGLENAKVDWAGRIIVDERMPPGTVALVSVGRNADGEIEAHVGRIEGIGGGTGEAP